MGFIKTVKTFFQSSAGDSGPGPTSPRQQALDGPSSPTSSEPSRPESSQSSTPKLPPVRGSSAREGSMSPIPPRLETSMSAKAAPSSGRFRTLGSPTGNEPASPRVESPAHHRVDHNISAAPSSTATPRSSNAKDSPRGSAGGNTPVRKKSSQTGTPPAISAHPPLAGANHPSFRRLHRQNSVPIMLEYGAGGLHPNGLPIDTSSANDVDPQALKTALAASVLARLKGPMQRQTSLKALLNLSQYDFVSDVNVSEAQLMVDPNLDADAILAGGNVGLQSGFVSGAIFSEVNALIDAADDPEDFNPESSGHSASQPPEGALSSVGKQIDPAAVAAALAASDSNVLAVSVKLPARMRRPKWSLKDYTLLKQLHKGYASEVFHAKCLISGDMVALKVYRLGDQCDLQRVQLYREIRLHSKLQHHNVVQFYSSFLEDNCVIIVQEFCAGGDLLKIMYKCGGRLFERQAVNLVLQPFLTSLQYLHTQGIVHRDIKPENVLFTEDKVLKLADFGLAIDLNEERANTRAGTLDYMAPEVLRCPTKKTPDENKGNPNSAHYHTGVDAWAVGVFAYELITGAAPFKANEMIETARNIIHAQVEFPQAVSELARDFISSALAKHPGDRPTVIEMLRHPWVTMFQRRSSVLAPSAAKAVTADGVYVGSMSPKASAGSPAAAAHFAHSMQGHPHPPTAGARSLHQTHSSLSRHAQQAQAAAAAAATYTAQQGSEAGAPPSGPGMSHLAPRS